MKFLELAQARFGKNTIQSKCSKRKRLAKLWKESRAKFSGLAQIPVDYKKELIGKKEDEEIKGYNNKEHTIKKIANFNAESVKNYSVIDVCFLKEGKYNTNGVEYEYDWETIDKYRTSYLGKPFYLNHSDTVGTEYGIIDSIYTKLIDGVNWLCAKVKIPEISLTQSVLDRIEHGLIKFVSSTHRFVPDETNPNRVKALYGVGISAVSDPEVEGAKIINIVRNNK